MTKEQIDVQERIIETAKLVFVRKGYEATKMGDIAAEVGISRTSMHYYFRTKEMLFDAIFEKIIGNLIPNITNIFREDGTILDKLPAVIEQYNIMLKKNPLFPLFTLTELQRDPQHLYKALLKTPEKAGAILSFKKYILKEMEDGTIRKMPLINVLSTFTSLMIFPVLIKNPLTDVLLNGDEKAFDEFLDHRKGLVLEIMTNLLKPE